jgi:HEAT repeat protein
MKFIVGAIVLAVAGYFAMQQLKPPPPPPPAPAPPPAIKLEPQPIINEAEQGKIIHSANDMDPNVRWESLILLDKMKSPKAIPLFFEKLRKDPDVDLRIKIVRLLGDRTGPDLAANLVVALRDAEPTVRVSALQALDRIGDYTVASAITEALKDQDETVRVQALKTLNSLQDKKTKEIEEEQKRQEELRRKAEEAARKR